MEIELREHTKKNKEIFETLLTAFTPDFKYDKLQHKPHVIAFSLDHSWEVIGFCFKLDNGHTYIVVPAIIEKPILMLLEMLWGYGKGFSEIEYVIIKGE